MVLLETKGKAVRKEKWKKVISGVSLMRRVSKWLYLGAAVLVSPQINIHLAQGPAWGCIPGTEAPERNIVVLVITNYTIHAQPRPHILRGNQLVLTGVTAFPSHPAKSSANIQPHLLLISQNWQEEILPRGVRSNLRFVEWKETDDEVGLEQLVLGTRTLKK